MGLDTSTMSYEQKMRFNKYLVFYDEHDDQHGVKGISAEAPKEIINEFIEWYRELTRYPTGRLRPASLKMYTDLIIEVKR